MNIENFIENNSESIQNIINLKSLIKLQDIKLDLINYLKSFEDLDDSLKFYYINEYINKNFKNIRTSNKSYICPCCLFFGNKNYCEQNGNYLKCNICKEKLNKENNTIDSILYKCFSVHSTSGYKCNNCNRFLPKSIAKNSILSCPYLDCIFVGNINGLKKMIHPSLKCDYESVNKKEDNCKAVIIPNESNIKDIILEEQNKICYTNNNYNLIHKLLVYRSFLYYLDESPDEMKDYLLNNSRRGGFQSKLFQKYIDLLETSLPFVIRKNKKIITINNLLDQNLCIFDGISVFESRIENFTIKNKTKEYYIGGRKGAYSKPYYIGKILDIIDVKNNESIVKNIDYYTFNKIKMKDLSDIDVIVKHLRSPPHYEMGGMVYVNRVRKNIISKLKNNGK